MSSQHACVTIWLEDLNKQMKSHHTLAAYQRPLEHFARWSETGNGNIFNLWQVMGGDIRDWNG